MKKATSKLAFLALALLAAGCVNEINEPAPSGNSVTLDFWAACESPASRVQLDTPSGGSAKVLWVNGDAIKFITSTGSTPQTFTVSGLDAPADMVHISLEANENDSWLYGVYGVNTSIEECSQESITLSGLAPSQQHYTNFFEAHASVAFAQKDASTGLFPDEVDFYNMVGIVTFKMDFSKFSFDMSDVHHVVFSSNDAPICSDGDVSVSFNSSGEPVIEPTQDCGTSITITPVAGKDEYFVAVLPATIHGFQIKFFDSNNNRLAKISTDKTLTVDRSKIVNLGDLTTLSAPILQKDDYINLSAEETANCYIAGLEEDYKFKATVRGCTNNSLDGTPVRAQVLWEANSSGNKTNPVSFGYIVKDVSFEDGYVYFTTNNRVGSALIAVYDVNDTCLWSWHIWVWPDYYNDANPLVSFSEKTKNALNLGAVYLMDRNLGADSDYPASGAKSDIRSWGFVYQWGRKDPFQPRKRYYAGSQPANKLASSAASDAEGSIQFARENPTTYIYSTASNKDWVVGTQNNNLWGDTKTESDPCPPGWKVPGARVFENAFGSTKNQTIVPPDDYIGFNLHNWIGLDSRDQMIYYPVPGYLDGTESQVYSNSSTVSHYWTSGTTGIYAYVMSTRYLSQQIGPKGSVFRHYGAHVRCMLDRELPPVRVTGVSLDHSSLSLSINQSVTLKATLIPSNPSNTAVTWSSSDPTKVYVDTNGKVTGRASTKVNGVDYPCTVTVTTDDGHYTATCQVSVAPSDIRDLSENGTANCYVVYEAGKYSFPVTVKGNSSESVGNVASLEILWQTTMTSTYSSGNSPIIPSVELVDGTCQFTIVNFVSGNAVIAAKNSSGTILWSWHIWACSGYNPDNSAYQQEYNNNAGTVMDRNIGALSATANDAKSLGLYYQWGRKDPFVGPATIATTFTGVSTYPSPWNKVACSSSTGTVSYAVAHPTTFITKNSGGDWMDSDNSGLWSPSSKTIYDPCPPGWRVPKGGSSGLWATASEQTQSFVSSPNAYGHVISGILAPGTVWYPFTGVKGASDGEFTNLAQYGFYWSASHMKTGYSYSFNLYSGSAKKCLTSGNYQKAGAVPVRCVKM